MAGLKSIAHMMDKIQQISDFLFFCTNVKYKITESRVVMINGDFDLGVHIIRDQLCEHLKKSHPDILFSYEPCIYQGVIIKYMYNDAKGSDNTGVCTCAKSCSGKGKNTNECRKVSIIVFHSGKVIITGAVTLDQVFHAKSFIVSESEKLVKFSS